MSTTLLTVVTERERLREPEGNAIVGNNFLTTK